MRLSWNEIRARAARFAEDWKDAKYERGEAQSFYNDFFEIFGVKRRSVAYYEERVKKLGGENGRIDLFWPAVLIVEQKSAGGNLVRAREQALEYFPGIKPKEVPRFVLVSDFQNFELYDLDGESEPVFCTLATLPLHVQAFGFILGIQKVTFRDQDEVNIDAAELMGALHDALEASGYKGHDLERFLVRVLFCLFADDASIFEPRGIFLDLLTQRTNEDGSDTGQWLSQLFEVLNTHEDRRQNNLDEDLKKFPYVNGDLFQERLRIPQFGAPMRKALIDAAEFNWERVSPAIFGSLFQSVMDKKERRAQGAHYTTEKNILKVFQPLFLDQLRAEFEVLKARRGRDRNEKLYAFHERLGKMRFFDPACGCGNFLIIAYRELRDLEIELIKAMFGTKRDDQGRLSFDVAHISKINVDQFYGIELGEFPARIAEVALWMMDHIMNNKFSLAFGENFARIPLKTSPHIHCIDALDNDWAAVLPPEQCSYVFGNPPFVGQSFQSAKQREQMARVIDNERGRAGSLDYVGAWFLKAGKFVQNGEAQIGFVATNSITQGEQVAQLWPLLFGRYRLEIVFAHRTFAWGSDARGKAHVHVVIIGLARREIEPAEKRLFSYEDVDGEAAETRHSVLSPYLFDASGLADRHLVVRESNSPLKDVPRLRMGSKIVDGGNFIFDEDQRKDFLALQPEAEPFLCPLVGSEEYINGRKRWILSLDSVQPNVLRSMPRVAERIAAVKEFRGKSKKEKTRALAQTPTRFEVMTIPQRPFLVIPEVSSERREYVPIGWLEPPTIPSNLVHTLVDADLLNFGLITSRIHMTWLRYIGGRLKNDYRYSIGLVYNTFPWPEASEAQKTKIRELAQAVLETRTNYPQATLADLYDPDLMKADLRKAHRDLDAAVDRLYRAKAFEGDRDRVEHLFGLYEKLTDPLAAAAKPAKKRKKKA